MTLDRFFLGFRLFASCFLSSSKLQRAKMEHGKLFIKFESDEEFHNWNASIEREMAILFEGALPSDARICDALVPLQDGPNRQVSSAAEEWSLAQHHDIATKKLRALLHLQTESSRCASSLPRHAGGFVAEWFGVSDVKRRETLWWAFRATVEDCLGGVYRLYSPEVDRERLLQQCGKGFVELFDLVRLNPSDSEAVPQVRTISNIRFEQILEAQIRGPSACYNESLKTCHRLQRNIFISTFVFYAIGCFYGSREKLVHSKTKSVATPEEFKEFVDMDRWKARKDEWNEYFLKGGRRCGQCGKNEDLLNGMRMLVCSRCRDLLGTTVFYCSFECQSLRWKTGHKRICGKTVKELEVPIGAKSEGVGSKGLHSLYSSGFASDEHRSHRRQLLALLGNTETSYFIFVPDSSLSIPFKPSGIIRNLFHFVRRIALEDSEPVAVATMHSLMQANEDFLEEVERKLSGGQNASSLIQRQLALEFKLDIAQAKELFLKVMGQKLPRDDDEEGGWVIQEVDAVVRNYFLRRVSPISYFPLDS